jgi:hypothetical protein
LDSYLSAQILLDHVRRISNNPSLERLVILGRGAIDEKSEKIMKKELDELSGYIKARHNLKSIQTGIYYSYNAKEKLRALKDKSVDDMVIHTAAKKGNTDEKDDFISSNQAQPLKNNPNPFLNPNVSGTPR